VPVTPVRIRAVPSTFFRASLRSARKKLEQKQSQQQDSSPAGRVSENPDGNVTTGRCLRSPFPFCCGGATEPVIRMSGMRLETLMINVNKSKFWNRFPMSHRNPASTPAQQALSKPTVSRRAVLRLGVPATFAVFGVQPAAAEPFDGKGNDVCPCFFGISGAVPNDDGSIAVSGPCAVASPPEEVTVRVRAQGAPAHEPSAVSRSPARVARRIAARFGFRHPSGVPASS
jgi:hypothetical protein